MKFIQVSFVFLWIISTIFACNVKDTDIGVCAKDVKQFCEIDLFPYTVQSVYESRACLRKNRDRISNECLVYLELDKPSIIEFCFPEMKTSCSNVVPGCFNIYSCLSGVLLEDLSADCQEALVHDQEFTGPKEDPVTPAKGYRLALWNSWTKSFTEITKKVLAAINKAAPGNNLRGSVFVEIMGDREYDANDEVKISQSKNVIHFKDNHPHHHRSQDSDDDYEGDDDDNY
mmetsp:Transcript_16033/g.17369  ORF Transcript_16033/g.17369 Transcript_16033/m.17369 type:complete len:230 (+) Transcript_16033:54-743(+)